MTVVEEGGFTGAQTRLNVSASTVSTRISDLEWRLGSRLCDRGRTGFRLTASGRSTFEATQRLFAAHEEFSSEVWSTRLHQQRVLRIGVVDNVISNKDFKLDAVLRQLCEQYGPVEIHMSTLSPSEIEQCVLGSELDIGIGVFFHKIPGLSYESFLVADQVLCCADGHTVFERVPDESITVEEVSTLPYVTRSYLGERSTIPGIPFKLMAYAQSMELIALLVLTGQYIGHLPRHYAKSWIDSDRMRVILPDQLGYQNHFGFTVRDAIKPGELVRSLSDLLLKTHSKID